MTKPCNKVGYTTKSEAKADLRHMRKLDRGGRVDRNMRPYHCPDCELWHLTSMAKKKQKAMHGPKANRRMYA